MDMIDLEAASLSDNVVAYCIPVNPEPWALGEISVVRNKSTGKLIPKVGPNANLVTYQEAIRAELESAGAQMRLPKYALRFSFCRVNASYTSASGRTLHRNAPDATNMQKATEDALQGVVIGNDRDVVSVQSVMLPVALDEKQGWVLIEILYGLEHYQSTVFPSGLTPAGLGAVTRMMDRLRNEDSIQDNDWDPTQE